MTQPVVLLKGFIRLKILPQPRHVKDSDWAVTAVYFSHGAVLASLNGARTNVVNSRPGLKEGVQGGRFSDSRFADECDSRCPRQILGHFIGNFPDLAAVQEKANSTQDPGNPPNKSERFPSRF